MPWFLGKDSPAAKANNAFAQQNERCQSRDFFSMFYLKIQRRLFWVVKVALFANLADFAIKFSAYLMTQSNSLMAESIHSGENL